jgi:CRP/FNR family transcriptional regulator, cyclic AMP receptor protein
MNVDRTLVAKVEAIPLFAGLTGKCAEQIAAQMKTYQFASGEAVIVEEDGGRFGRLFVIIDGTATATVGGREVATYGPGDSFGEMSVLDGKSRSATVTATSELSTLGLASWNMRSLMQEHPEIALHMVDVLVARVRAMDAKLLD